MSATGRATPSVVSRCQPGVPSNQAPPESGKRRPVDGSSNTTRMRKEPPLARSSSILGRRASSVKRSSIEAGSSSTRRPFRRVRISAASSPRTSAVAGAPRVVCRARSRIRGRTCVEMLLNPESASFSATAWRVPASTVVTAIDAGRTARRNSSSCGRPTLGGSQASRLPRDSLATRCAATGDAVVITSSCGPVPSPARRRLRDLRRLLDADCESSAAPALSPLGSAAPRTSRTGAAPVACPLLAAWGLGPSSPLGRGGRSRSRRATSTAATCLQ